MYSKYMRVITLLGPRCTLRHSSLYTYHGPTNNILHPTYITNRKTNNPLFLKSQQYISSERKPPRNSRNGGKHYRKNIRNNIIICSVFGSLAYYMYFDHDEHLQLNSGMMVDPPIPNVRILGINAFPLVKKVFQLMPDNMRKYIGTKMVNIFCRLLHN